MLKRIFQSVFGHQSTPNVVNVLQELENSQALLHDKERTITKLSNDIGYLQEQISYLVNNPTVKEVQVDHFTFTPESYRKFKRNLESPVCTANTSPTQAAYFLGICRVLTELEDKHVTNR